MFRDRRWQEYPSRLGKQLNGTGGYLGVAGLLLAGSSMAAGAVFAGPLLIGGAVVAGGAGAYSTFAAIPPKLKNPAEHLQQPIAHSELASFFPPVVRIGTFGDTLVGKTTLKAFFCAEVPPTHADRTSEFYSYIATLKNRPDTYVAITDGAGDQYSHQLESAENAEILFVLFDHNRGDDKDSVVRVRLREQLEKLIQLDSHLQRKRNEAPIFKTFVLFNKQDLWPSDDPAQMSQLEEFFNSTKKIVENARWTQKFQFIDHSNRSSNNMIEIERALCHTIDELRESQR